MKNLLLVLFLFFSHLFIICQDCDFNTKFKGNSNLYISDNSWFHKAIRWYSSYETNMPRYNWDNPSGYWPQVEAKVFTDEDVCVIVWKGNYKGVCAMDHWGVLDTKKTGSWGTGAEVGLYKKHKGLFHDIYYRANMQLSKMEMRLYKKQEGYSIEQYLALPDSELIVSCSHNLGSGNKKTWWLTAWAGSDVSILESWKTTLLFRVKEMWGCEWQIWEGEWKGIEDINWKNYKKK